mmetsp:Transcript_3957/g.8954  ORF Transcript_3957/g.8954 Transcript_3957/m.8954 type:complete len:231 (+) Transcript_3957:1009-1701(+)
MASATPSHAQRVVDGWLHAVRRAPRVRRRGYRLIRGPSGTRGQRVPQRVLGMVVARHSAALPVCRTPLVQLLPIHGVRRARATLQAQDATTGSTYELAARRARQGRWLVLVRTFRRHLGVGGTVGARRPCGVVIMALAAYHSGCRHRQPALQEARMVSLLVPDRRHERPLRQACADGAASGAGRLLCGVLDVRVLQGWTGGGAGRYGIGGMPTWRAPCTAPRQPQLRAMC